MSVKPYVAAIARVDLGGLAAPLSRVGGQKR